MSYINELIENECIKEGNFKLKNGQISKYYFDMKRLISYPKLLSKIGDAIYELIDKKNCDLLCGVPIGGIPICSYISTKYNIPMIIVRDEVKSYGSCKQIEGNYSKNSKCVIIEDVITTGSSVENTINILKEHVNVTNVLVIIDRQQNFNCSVPVKSLITKTDIVRERLLTIMKEKDSQLCFSADVEDKKKLFDILDNIGDTIVICKIHYDIYNDIDSSFKEKLIEYSIKYKFLIMEDRKFIDISYISHKQNKIYENWVDMVTIMAFVTDDVIRCMSGVLIVANMSNNNWDMTKEAIALSRNNSKNVLGFITQKRIIEDNKLSFTPGVNISKSKISDQNYRNTSEIDTDIIIVGRGIYNSDNYKEAVKLYKKI